MAKEQNIDVFKVIDEIINDGLFIDKYNILNLSMKLKAQGF